MKKVAIIIFLALFVIAGMSAQNLVDSSTWTVGVGSAPGFNRSGTDAENVREMGIGPHSDSVLLWACYPDTANNVDGGWITDYYSIDYTKTYRLTVWIKKTNSNDGNTNFGFNSQNSSFSKNSLALDGTLNANPYFFSGDLPQLDQWYLLVGYVHESSYSSTVSSGGIYDLTGTKVLSITDFKFSPEVTTLRHRNYLFYDLTTADRQYFFDPTVYEVNGTEPTIQELVDNGTNNSGSGLWTQSGSTLFYNDGNVGIGTGNTDAKLTVKGNIHAEEVKVDLLVPAPDYVFKENYNLLSIEEIKNYIDTYGHLPNISSAKVLEANGVQLGSMSMKLLEKIEELTLYTIGQEDNLKQKEEQLKALEIRIKKIEVLLNKK